MTFPLKAELYPLITVISMCFDVHFALLWFQRRLLSFYLSAINTSDVSDVVRAGSHLFRERVQRSMSKKGNL